jgi:hypothetical protein
MSHSASTFPPTPEITGGVLSSIVIVLDTGTSGLPQMSVAVHVSTTEPLQYPGTVVVKVEGFDVPDIKHPPLNPLV